MAGTEEGDQRAEFLFRADSRPDIEAQSGIGPQRVAALVPRRGEGDRGREFRADRGVPAQRERVGDIIERRHGILLTVLGPRQPRVSVARDLRQRPDIAAGNAALARLVEAPVDPPPVEISILGQQDEARQVILVLQRIAEPRLHQSIARSPRGGGAIGQPVVIFQL